MSKTTPEKDWFIFTENREQVIAALERGECDGILPAARGFLDGFAGFMLESGVVTALEAFRDPRARRTIPMFFFCNILLHRPLFKLSRLAQIEDTLFRSPYIMRQLGFNARQIEAGFYQTADSQRPFTVKALTTACARLKAADFLANQQQVLKTLVDYCPGEFQSALWAMDSVHIHVPAGAHTLAHNFKACVLGIWQTDVVWPLLWAFVPENTAEITVGRQLLAAAEAVLGPGTITHLVVDRGYIDGEWLTTLYEHGTRVTLGVKEDMLVLEEMRNLSQIKGATWEPAQPPKIHATPPERALMSLQHLRGEWDACQAPLSGCLIRDTYADNTIKYYGLVTTAPDIPAATILADNGHRWILEEVFMTLTCYWRFDDLPPSRPGVAYAMVHFALLAFTLLGFYLQEREDAPELATWNFAPPPIPLPERELAVYAGPYFALLLPSQLIAIILTHIDAWQTHQKQLLFALRLCEGNT